MASLGTAFVRILPDTSGMGSELSKSLGLIMPGLAASFAANGAKMGKLFGESVSKGIIAGAAVVATAGFELFKIGDEFDKAYDKIRIGTGATGKSFDALKTNLKDVAMGSSASIGDIGTAIADLNTRTGLTGPALETLTRQMLILTSRTGGDLKTNIRETARLFGDWSIASKDQSAALDYVFKASQQTGVGIAALEADIVKFGAPMRQFGFSFQDAAALLGKWEKEGVNTQTVLAGLRMGLGNLTSETKRHAIEKDLGIKLSSEPKIALQQIIEAIKNAGTQAEANQIALQAFGKRAGPDMAAAVREGRFEIDGLKKSINDSNETIIGASGDVKSFSQAWGQLKNIMKVAVEPIATKFFTELSKLMIGLVDGIRNNKSAWEGLTTTFKVLGIAVGVVFEAIKIGITIFWTWLGIVFKALKYEIGAAQTVFQAMGRAFTSVSDTLVAVWQTLDRAGRTVFGALQLVWNTLWHAGETAVNGLIAAWNALWHAGENVVHAITVAWGAFTDFFVKLPGRIVGFFTALPGQLLNIGKTVMSSLLDGITTAASAVWDFFKKLPDRIFGAIGFAAGWLTKTGIQIVTGLINGIESAANGVADFFKNLPGRITGFILNAGSWLFNTGKSILNGLVSGLNTAVGAVTDFFKGLPGRIVSWAVNAGTWLVNTGKDILHGLVSGLTSAYDAVSNFFKTLPGKMLSFMTGAGSWLLNIGKTIVGGLVSGLTSAYDAVASFFKGMPGKIAGFMTGAGSWLLGIGKTIIGGFVSGLTTAVKAVADFFAGMPKTILNAMKDAGKWLFGAGKDIITGLFNGILDAIKAVGSWIKEHIFNPIVNGFKSAFGMGSPSKVFVELGKDIITGLLNGIAAAAVAVFNWFKGLAGKVLSAVGNAAGWLLQKGKDALGGLLSGISLEAVTVFGWFKTLASKIVSAIGNAGTWLVNAGKSIITGLFNGIGNIGAAIGAVGSWFWTHVGSPFVSGLGSLGGTLGTWLVNAGKAVIAGLFTGIGNIGAAIGAVGAWFWTHVGQPFVSGLGNLAGTLGTWLLDAGKAVISGLFNGVKGAMGGVGGWLKSNVADPFISGFKGLFGIGSPSTVMTVFGKDIMTGLQNGITAGSSGPVTAMGAAGRSIISSITGVQTAAASAATRVGAEFGKMTGSATTLASSVTTRTGQINASTNGMATNTGAAVGRVIGSLTQQDTKTNQTQANHATRTSQISAQANSMTTNIGAAVGRFIGSMTQQDTKTNQTQANHATRTSQISAQENNMVTSIGSAVGRFIGSFTQQDTKTNQTQANHGTRTGQITSQQNTMTSNVGSAVGRFIGSLTQQDTKTNQTQANHGTRMGQISAGATGMANTVGTQTGRVIGSYTGMQSKVDSLHGKSIAVSSAASVTYPSDAALKAALAHAASVLGAAVAVANGAIFNRANGGIDRLPDSAIISPAKGPGIVNWAESETGGEAFIPLAANKRARSLEIWRRTGDLLGAFASGGLLDISTLHNNGNWNPQTDRLQTLSEEDAKYLGNVSAKRLADLASGILKNVELKTLIQLLAPHGPGFSMGGNWAAGIRPWVEYVAKTMNVSANTYAGHHPAESHAVDLAIGQDGMKNTAPATGISGPDLYSRVAAWIDTNILGKPTPGWYVGTHAAIHTRGGAWHPASSQIGRRGQTYAHDDHVHLSFDPRVGGPIFGVPSNYSAPGFNWDHGGAAPIAAGASLGIAFSSSSGAGTAIGAGISGGVTQAQMEAAMRAAGADPALAHIFSAIGMAENPGSRPVTNQFGTFDGPWAMIRGQPGVDSLRQNTDLLYAAQQALALYRRAGFGPWEGYTAGGYLKFMAEGGILDQAMSSGLTDRFRRTKLRKALSQGDEDWGKDQTAIRGIKNNLRTYDQGGYLQPGITLAQNATGQPERVVPAATDEKTTRLLMQMVALIGEQNSLLRRMPSAQADALNSVAYRAMAYR